MSGKHTAGKWEVETKCAECGIYFRFGFSIVSHDANKRICYSETDNAANISEMEANADLLSAAPDMREALAEAVEKYGKPGGPWNVPGEPGSWIAKAKEALKKADGGAR